MPRTTNVRRSLLAVACALGLLEGGTLAAAEEAKTERPPVLVEPTTVDDCLKTMETVLSRALDADMLDDQIDKAEAELEKMEEHCLDRRFSDALHAAQTVERMVASNK